MNVYYLDEYDVELLKINSDLIASVGDTVIIDDEEYRVKARSIYPDKNTIAITLTQNTVRTSQKEDVNSARLAEVGNAIIKANKRIDEVQKKNTVLTEQVGTLKRNLNAAIKQTPQIKKDTL